MKRWMGLAAIAVAVGLCQADTAMAQNRGLSNRDRLFLLYNQNQNQMNARMLMQNQQNLSRQLSGSRSVNLLSPGSNSVDPIQSYIQNPGQPQRQQPIPRLYQGNYRQQSYFQRAPYFNPNGAR
ncbi:MAG: hypothetical protein ACRC1K_05695 [Planctomycetia bacterium]